MECIIYNYKDGENIVAAYQEYQYDNDPLEMFKRMVPGLRTWKGQCQYKRKPRVDKIAIDRFFPGHRGKAYITGWNKDTKIATFQGSGPLYYRGVDVDKLGNGEEMKW